MFIWKNRFIVMAIVVFGGMLVRGALSLEPKHADSSGNIGIVLFIDACRVQADHSVMYRTARFECETSAFPYNDDFFREKVLISGNFPERTLVRTEKTYPKSSPYYDGSNEASVILQRDGVDIGLTSVYWTPGAREAVIDKGLRAVPEVFSFGRIKGFQAEIDTSLLAVNKPKSTNRYDFSQESIDFFYKYVADYKRELGISLHQYVRDEKYDGQSIAKVVECRTEEGVLYQEYWIDPSRGHVCPVVRCYDKQDGSLLEEYNASYFFQDKVSGLWFPAHYTETHLEKTTGRVIHKRIYRIDPVSFRLNSTIADSEFSVDIPEGAIVSDRKKEESMKFFQAVQNGELSFTEGGLDLNKME